MLETLTDRLGQALRRLRGADRLSADNMAEALQEVRKALLAADVHFRVAREFIDRVQRACDGQQVLASVTPAQMVVKIIHDELVELLGAGASRLADRKPLRILLLGLQGSGKTTFAAKLARHLAKQGYQPALVAADIQRPAAIDQLQTLALEAGVPCHCDRAEKHVPTLGRRALETLRAGGADAIIFDTAGRLQIDAALVAEVRELRAAVDPDEVLLVADAALGQEAVNVARVFHEQVGLTGIVLTKIDGDSRGGAALSMKAVTGVPIKFLGTGEKLDNIEIFHPDRLAGRILGMGDVVSLVEKAQEAIDEKEAERMAEKFRQADFNFEDFLKQMQAVKKMGPLEGLMKMMPGMGQIQMGEREEKKMRHTEALIQSMTPQERRNPAVLNGSRRTRIAAGAGLQVRDLNSLIKQFQQMRQMMKMMQGNKARKLMKKFERSGMQLPGGFPS
jgi:signal recognition particle subunit SRP54